MATTPLAPLLGHLRQLAAGRGAKPQTDRELLDDFAGRNDEAAFAALVSRHGPMVLRVCRRVLRHEQDAEDAFQATFLVLARGSRSIRKRDSVGEWLHGVAYRTAMKAKRGASRRRNHETRSRADAHPEADGPRWDDVQAVLDEEVQRLPACFREAFVLCVLEGKGVAEAASELGCKAGTVKSRVHRARRLLEQQLTRRGIELAALLAALSVAESSAKAALPVALARAAIRTGLLAAAGSAAAEMIPAHVAALAAGVARAMFFDKVLTVVLSVGLLVTGTGVVAHQSLPAGGRPIGSPGAEVRGQKSEQVAAKPPAADEQGDGVELRGRVVGPDGKPVAGAKVFFVRYILPSDAPPSPAVLSDAEGRFRLRISRTGYPEPDMKPHWMRGVVVAVGRGFAPGWAGGNGDEPRNVTIRLAGGVPIQGRVVDLQGKPVAGVSVEVRNVRVREDGGDLKAFVGALRTKKEAEGPHRPMMGLDPALLGLTRPVLTGTDGKFRLTGIAGECLVRLRFAGQTIETAEVYAMTRPAPTVVTPRSAFGDESEKVVFHGNTFDHAAAPTRPVVGVVRDRHTGKPLAGVTVQARIGSARNRVAGNPTIATTTDAEGRYRLVGLSREGHCLEVLPALGQPYLPVSRTVGATPGLDPLTSDIALVRGVLLRGRVTDKETGRPVPALVQYFVLADNPRMREVPGLLSDRRGDSYGDVRTAEDGSFTLVGLAGGGLLAVKAANGREGHYLMAVGADRIEGPREGDTFTTDPSICRASSYNTLAGVNPVEDAESVVRDIVLDPGKTVTGTVVGPDGKPVKGVSIDSVFGVRFAVKDLPTAAFRITGVDPKLPRSFYFRHPATNLGAAVLLKGNEPMPLTVRLQKCATLTGRLVDDDGLPRSGWLLGTIHRGQLGINSGVGCFMEGIGKDGRFRIEGVIPGLKIGLLVGNPTTSAFSPLVSELTLEAGAVKDLGDVKVEAMP